MRDLDPVLPTYAALRVVSSEKRGSSWPLVLATTGPTVLAKLRGAGHGTAPLVAEVVTGHLAERLGLNVPRRVLVWVDDEVESENRDAELLDLLRASRGLNLGMEFLGGARDFRPETDPVDPDDAARILWLDWLVMNPDRTPRSPNLMVREGEIWLVDHGSALPFQYGWSRVTEDAPTGTWSLPGEHVFQDRAAEVDAWRELLADALTREDLGEALARVPAEWLEPMAGPDGPSTSRRREAYVAFLWKRLRSLR